jgi:peptidyl-prolyl cis-trans isomerase D
MLIQRLRDGTEGILAKVIIGLIIIVFGLFGFGSITTFLAPVPKVATVNGQDVTQQDMEIAVERNRRVLQARGSSPDQFNEDELRDNVLKSLISREILSQATEKFNLYYSDALLDGEITASEVFKWVVYLMRASSRMLSEVPGIRPWVIVMRCALTVCSARC